MRRGLNILNSILVGIAFIGLVLAFILYSTHLRTAEQDKIRKQSINAIYFGLEHDYYTQNASYPLRISAKNLPSVTESSFIDPDGRQLGSAGSDYRYEPYGCVGEVCKGYTLRAILDAEDTYIKQSN